MVTDENDHDDDDDDADDDADDDGDDDNDDHYGDEDVVDDNDDNNDTTMQATSFIYKSGRRSNNSGLSMLRVPSVGAFSWL